MTHEIGSNLFFKSDVGNCAPPSKCRHRVVVAVARSAPFRVLISSKYVHGALAHEDESAHVVVRVGYDEYVSITRVGVVSRYPLRSAGVALMKWSFRQ